VWLSTSFAIMHYVATHVFNKVLQELDRDPICCLLSWFCVIAPSPSCQLNPPHVSDSMLARCVLIHQCGINMSEGFQPNLYLFQTEQCELCCDLNVYVRSWCIWMLQIGVIMWTSQLDWFLLLLLWVCTVKYSRSWCALNSLSTDCKINGTIFRYILLSC
jgi:hypothetical protein